MKTPMARADKRNLPATGIDGDRLSSLPGEILSYILSFLETKYAVSTSILSRRWKYLWTRVSILDLVDSLHVPSQEPRDLAFSRFVDRVLSEHMNLNSVRRLRLLFSTNSRPSSSFWCKMELDSHASQLEEIDVRPPRHSGMRGLPQSFYALKNLMVLKLDFVMLTPGDGYVFLPSLKVLQLFSVEITDCESLARLFSGCPVLETLRMKYCYSSISDKNENYVITASLPSLKNLAIIGTGGHDPNLCLIVVDAPSLEHLHLEDFEEFGFWGSSQLPCLVSARIDIRWTHEEHPLIGFLTHISNAKKLWLSGRILSLLAVLVQDVQLPVFPKLTHLTLEGGGSSCVLHPFLNSASQLQSLVICFGSSLARTKWEESEPARTPKCLLSSLEEFEINDLAAGEDEMKMVAYLLKAGAVLNKVNLRVVDVDLDIKDRKVLASLLKLPRGSSACEVHLFYSNNEIPDEDFFTMMPFIC